jgi:prephenate dehydrogenase
LIEKVGPIVPENVLLTDVGSTKQEIVERALAVFGAAAATRFLPGHPMAGKECGGIESADASLFEGAAWLVTPARSDERNVTAPIAEAWLEWLRRIGARVLVMDAARHDRLCAWISHLPQMIATALAATLKDEFGDDAELGKIGGRALREMTRIAASPYSMWRDIAFTNTKNIEEAISGLEQRLAHLRENLKTRGLQEEFERANEFRKY